MENPEIKSVDILLQERMPSDMLITKEKKEKTRRIKYSGYDNYVEKRYTKIEEFPRRCNVLSNENYLIEINDKGEGFSKYKDILINKYKETLNIPKGIFFYIRNLSSGKVWKANYEMQDKERYEVTFAEDVTEFSKLKYGVETDVKVVAASKDGTEIRSIKLKNTLEDDINLEVIRIILSSFSKNGR